MIEFTQHNTESEMKKATTTIIIIINNNEKMKQTTQTVTMLLRTMTKFRVPASGWRSVRRLKPRRLPLN